MSRDAQRVDDQPMLERLRVICERTSVVRCSRECCPARDASPLPVGLAERMMDRAADGLVIAENHRSVPTAVVGETPSSRINMGAISAPRHAGHADEHAHQKSDSPWRPIHAVALPLSRPDPTSTSSATRTRDRAPRCHEARPGPRNKICRRPPKALVAATYESMCSIFLEKAPESRQVAGNGQQPNSRGHCTAAASGRALQQARPHPGPHVLYKRNDSYFIDAIRSRATARSRASPRSAATISRDCRN